MSGKQLPATQQGGRVEIDKDDVTIVGTAVAWLVTIFLGGRSYEKLSCRVDTLEDRPPCVPVVTCEERRQECCKLNTLQFAHGADLFTALQKEITATRAEAKEQHKEIMQILREMSQ
jgi:hypothetical protein